MLGRLLVAVVIGAVALVTGGAAQCSAAAPVNDDFASRLQLQPNTTDSRSNSEAGIEADEQLTANDPAGQGCELSGQPGSSGVKMERTMWWGFTGNGSTMTVTTSGSNFDTVLAVYEAQNRAVIGCNDDRQPHDPTRPNLEYDLDSEVQFQTIAGRSYAVQVGGCSGVCGAGSGNVLLQVATTPANDSVASARVLNAGTPITVNNVGATVEAGETTICGLSPYAKTVWFRFSVPAPGTARFTSTGLDTVIAVYRDSSKAPLSCNDDDVKGISGGSGIPASAPAGPRFDVVKGEYLLQVGGYYDPGFSAIAARSGPIEVKVDYVEDLDVDDDGVERNRDCNDSDPAVHPGAPEIPNNEVDEDCDGALARDRDNDGYLAAPLGSDCNDSSGKIHPGAREIRGNQVDEDCDQVKAQLQPLPVSIGIYGYPEAEKTKIKKIYVSAAPAEVKIEITCHGHGCPYHRKARTLGTARAKIVIAKDLVLGVGARLEVRVSKDEWIGKGRSFLIRADADPISPYFCFASSGKKRPCK